MKKLSLLICAAISVNGIVFAQEAIHPDIPDIASPVIGKDGSVTFSLFAPKAENVMLTGNVLRELKDTLPDGTVKNIDYLKMNNNEGLWTLTLNGLTPDFYSYKFLVDGVETLDPLNSYVLRDVRSISSTFLLPGLESELFIPANVPHGSLSEVWYNSKSDGLDRRLSIYTPPAYDDMDRAYPVLYLLHGMGGDETAWVDQGKAVQILDNMIARGLIEPMIVVMPNGNIARQAAPGYDSFALEQPQFNLPHTIDGLFEELFPEIVDFIDNNYRTKPDRKSRAIAGLSMGGLHSLYISANYPEKFGYVGLFSAATDPIRHNPEGLPRFYEDRSNKMKKFFDSSAPVYFIAIGKDDFLYDVNTQYRKELDSLNLPYIYEESNGGHEWSNWRQYLIKFLPMLFKE